MLSLGDNKSANSWVCKLTTESLMGQKALRLYAEYTQNSEVALSPDHIRGVDNVVADGISRVNEFFSPQKSHVYDVPFPHLVQQVCTNFTELKSWRIFLPNQQFLSDLNWIFSSSNALVAPKRRPSCGQFVPVAHISSGIATTRRSSTEFFL